MENHISLRPNPTVVSYLKHFQIAQLNLDLFVKEEQHSRKRFRQRFAKKRKLEEV